MNEGQRRYGDTLTQVKELMIRCLYDRNMEDINAVGGALQDISSSMTLLEDAKVLVTKRLVMLGELDRCKREVDSLVRQRTDATDKEKIRYLEERLTHTRNEIAKWKEKLGIRDDT